MNEISDKPNKLDLISIFNEISTNSYVIVKLNDEFPEYIPGSDIDIFVKDIDEFSRKILSICEKYINQEYFLNITKINQSHVHIDMMEGENINFRFDLYGELPSYNKINIKKYLFYSIIDRSKKIMTKDVSETKCYIYVPEYFDDLLIRYLEYLEYYEERQSKIKHIDYIYDKMKELTNEERNLFFDRLHLYTDLPEEINKSNNYLFNKYFSTVKYYLYKIKQKGFKKIIKQIWYKVGYAKR